MGLCVSGGVDSMALSVLASNWAANRSVDLDAFIINHGLRPGSQDEQLAVAANLEKLGITPHLLRINLEGISPKRIELEARNRRISAIRAACERLKIDTVLFGHHKDDQYETFIMRSLLNSTWYGLAGMRPTTNLDETFTRPVETPIRAIRPLLDFTKDELYSICRQENVQWFEDATNADPTLTIRNAIRKLKQHYEPLLPVHLQPQHVWALQHKFQLRRQRADTEASTLLKLYAMDGSLVLDYKTGTAQFELTSEFHRLCIDTKVSLIHKLVTFVTPLDMKDLAYRRGTVQTFVESGYAKKAIANVVAEVRGDTLHIGRSKLRRTDVSRTLRNIPPTSIYKATQEWSEWTLIDNRFWFRWRLPATTKKTKLLGIVMVQSSNVNEIRKKVFKQFGKTPPLECSTQPLFVFTDGVSVVEFVGYPTLNTSQNLEVEQMYKQVDL